MRQITARFIRLAAALPVLLGPTACQSLLPDAPEDNEVLDAPLDGLNSGQLAAHLAGDESFGRRFSPEEGMGPLFLAQSCDQCHVGEGKGHPLFNITRFGRFIGEEFDFMKSEGGPQLQNRAIPGHPPERLPSGATGVAAFMPPAVTGLGFLEAVDDATLLALSDPDDLDSDGISGRVQLLEVNEVTQAATELEARLFGSEGRGTLVEGKFIGRFGRKGLNVNLLQQTVGALSEDMGLTSDLLPNDLINVQVGNFATDEVPDPEVTSDVLNNLVFYLKTLRQPLRRNESDADVMAGEALFSQINCSGCHLPNLRTGRSEIVQLDRVEFHAYTDLLLHDMGAELNDGYTEGIASPSEWRTTPLWGLGLSASFQGGQGFFLHDGRAATLREAIDFHGGEAAASRTAFQSLSSVEQAQLLAFLRSL